MSYLFVNELKTDLFKILKNIGCGTKFVDNDFDKKNLYDKSRARGVVITEKDFLKFRSTVFRK